MRKVMSAENKLAAVAENAANPDGMSALCGAYLKWAQTREFSILTIDQHRRYLNAFFLWARSQQATQPMQVTRTVLMSYHESLVSHHKKDGEPLSATTRKCYLSPIRSWFRWLARNGHIPFDPAVDLELPKAGRVLPRHILTAPQVEAVLRRPDISDPLGLRDRAILETFYSTGMRRRELAALMRSDLDGARNTIHIRQGKGRKDRVIPIGTRALMWVTRYEHEARPELVAGQPDCESLFLTRFGNAFTPYRLSQLVSGYVAAAKLGKQGSCHLFRHTAATLMLENGCDIRFLQALLGHASLTTTQLYTHVSIARLTEAHRATHPAECGGRKTCRA